MLTKLPLHDWFRNVVIKDKTQTISTQLFKVALSFPIY